MKILEAMAAGVPVISTLLGAEGLAVTSGKDILLTEPDDAEGWLRHLTAVVDDKDQRAHLVQAALELTHTRYDWEILGRKLFETYEDWLQGRE